MCGPPAHGAELRFADGSAIEVFAGEWREVKSVKVETRTILGQLESYGKAVPVPAPVVAKLSRKRAAEVRRIHSAFLVRQGNERFYIPGLASIGFEVPRACRGCQIRCEAYLLQVSTAAGDRYLVVLKTLTPVPNPPESR